MNRLYILLALCLPAAALGGDVTTTIPKALPWSLDPTAIIEWVFSGLAGLLALISSNVVYREAILVAARRAALWVEEEQQAGRLAADVDKLKAAIARARRIGWAAWFAGEARLGDSVQAAVAADPTLGATAAPPAVVPQPASPAGG